MARVQVAGEFIVAVYGDEIGYGISLIKRLARD